MNVSGLILESFLVWFWNHVGVIFESFWVDFGIIFEMNLGSFGYDFEDYFEWFAYIYIYILRAREGVWNVGRPQIQIDMKIHEFSKSGKRTGLSKWTFEIIKIIFKIIPNMILKIPISTPPRVYIRSHSKVIFKIKNPFKIVWKISSSYNFMNTWARAWSVVIVPLVPGLLPATIGE